MKTDQWKTLTGSEAQQEWAVRIRLLVDQEFDRVAAAFRAVGSKQDPIRRAETDSILAILEDKRAEVMGMDRAGYFIQEWQELRDQVRRLIVNDPRYQAIKADRTRRVRPE